MAAYLQEEMVLAVEAARGAGRIVLSRFGRVERKKKRHAEAVTEADREAQRFILEQIRRRYPSDGVIGEENETGDGITFECPDPDARVWVVDPLDGTNNFVAGFPAFAVSIGMLERGWPVLGVVLDVCRGQIYQAAKGGGASLDGRPIRAAQTALDDSSLLMITSNILDGQGRVPGYAVKWIGQTVWKLRCIGSAALETVQVAAGVAHGALTVNGKLWDAAAPAAVVLEAGGIVTDLGGDPVFPFDLRRYDGGKVPFLAAAPRAHATLLRQIRDNP